MHLYMPWWKFDRKNDFLRGYHIEFGGGRGLPGVGEFEEVAPGTKGTALLSSSDAEACTAHTSIFPGAAR